MSGRVEWACGVGVCSGRGSGTAPESKTLTKLAELSPQFLKDLGGAD